MKPEDITRLANREKGKANPKPNVKPAKQKVYKTYDAFSFYTYRKIYPGGMNFMLWFLLCVPALTLLIIYFTDNETGKWALYSGIVCFGIFLIRWIIDFFLKITTYRKYKSFAETLGFRLEGWEKLGSYPLQLKTFYWSKKTSVEIFLKEDAKEEKIRVLKDALYLFVKSANEKFYEAEIGGDGRDKWTNVHSLKVNGSSNVAVISHLYKLINVYLRSVQDEFYVIDSVKVEFGSTIFEVNPPPSTD